jgi:glycosyltransferase involved in cell wall biosynthesis
MLERLAPEVGAGRAGLAEAREVGRNRQSTDDLSTTVTSACAATNGGGILHLLRSLEVGGLERAVVRLASRGREAAIPHHLFLYDLPFRQGGGDVDPLDVPWTFHPRQRGLDLVLAHRIASYARERMLNVVHAHNVTSAVYAALARRMAWPRRLRVVVTIHTLPGHHGPLARGLVRWALRQSDRVVAVSHELRHRLREARWLAECGVIRNGIQLDRFSPAVPALNWRRRLGIAPHVLLVGHLGRFDPLKRHADLVAAARLLEIKMPGSFAFLLAGDGPGRTAIVEAAADLSNVYLPGVVQEVSDLLRCLDIFMLCSDHEGTPLALLEAMATGVPSVCTAVGDIPRIVGAGTKRAAALLVRPGDPVGLAEAVAVLAQSRAERERLGLNARRLAAGMSFEGEWGSYFRIYAELVASVAAARLY